MDLFDYMRENTMEKESPLASRLRPRTLDEVSRSMPLWQVKKTWKKWSQRQKTIWECMDGGPFFL